MDADDVDAEAAQLAMAIEMSMRDGAS
eukprot:COSAG06_NODE_18006_length_909_cov_0.823457_2_plen_26_part_01